MSVRQHMAAGLSCRVCAAPAAVVCRTDGPAAAAEISGLCQPCAAARIPGMGTPS